jgi:myosin-1
MMRAIPDLVLMSELSENEMYNVLTRRLKEKRIYTYIGDVLISVNPYTQLPIYGAERINEHKGQLAYNLEPHVYAIAENMYRQLMAGEGNPAVLISGESGAGKTEAARKVLEYVAAVSKEGAGVARIKQMLLDSNPILEAFGNAKTLRNDNSSRFGKYMEIVFDFSGAPQGGRITNFLLEKVRVVGRNEGERAFHIFYQMLAGLSDAEITGLTGGTREPDAFEFLKKSKCHTVPGMNDKAEFKKVRDAMKR